jgi:hypothetical protein
MGLGRRLARLEASAGQGCPRCAGVVVAFVNGCLQFARRRGESLGGEERAELEGAGSGRSACGSGFLEIRVPSEIPGEARAPRRV